MGLIVPAILFVRFWTHQVTSAQTLGLGERNYLSFVTPEGPSNVLLRWAGWFSLRRPPCTSKRPLFALEGQRMTVQKGPVGARFGFAPT